MPVKITEIRLYHLSAKLPETIGNAKIFFDRRDTLLVEVVAGNLSGWGETWALPAAAASVVKTHLAPLVLGQNPQHYRRIWQDMMRAFETRSGVATMAIAAIDMALHDLAARERDIPLHELIGGARRGEVTTYASGPFFKPDGHPYRDFEKEVEGYLAAGFKSIKLRSGYSAFDDAKAARLVRSMIGIDADLMIDFNQSITPRNAIATYECLADVAPLWIEEPAPPGDLAGYQLVRSHMRCAIAGGETFGAPSDFLPFLDAGVFDVLQPDIAICAGLSGTSQVAVLAELHHRAFIPHVWGSVVNFHAALHLTATLAPQRAGGQSPFPFMEFDVGANPLLDLAGRPTVTQRGTIEVPQSAGLGITLSPVMLEPFTVDHVALS